jgi:serine/threonine-protein kinase HipA
MEALTVYLQHHKVGELTLNEQRQYVFTYIDSWLNEPNNMALSISLPLTRTPYVDGPARTFFANLLPEALIRDTIARQLGISAKNDFALLTALGGECAGAITLIPATDELPIEATYRKLSLAELAKLLENLPKKPLLAGEKGLRLSLAGAQSKLPIYWHDKQFYLPQEGAASSHIIKPPMRDYPDTVENELFCMLLAKALGLPVPSVYYIDEPVKFYLIERYDRQKDTQGQLVRIHQEDFCQALNIPPDYKYEAEGGPTFVQCFNLAKHYSTRPAADQKALLQWLILNYVIGNADAHAKNLSLLLLPEGPRLAPFYDLLGTTVYPELTAKMAMKIGGEARPEWLQARHWQRLAEQLGIKYALLKQLQQQLLSQLPKAMQKVQAYFTEQSINSAILPKITAIMEKRCQYLTR